MRLDQHLPLIRRLALACGGLWLLSVPLVQGLAAAASKTATSINSTSQSSLNGVPTKVVPQQPLTTTSGYQIVSTNDLGMHCGDLDARVASILPPFNVVHAQLIQTGASPVILDDSDYEMVYSAAASNNDPALQNPGTTTPGGTPIVYKTNFWDVATSAYDPFYPVGILPLFYPPSLPIVDVGLPVPDNELLYLEAKEGFNQGVTVLDQQPMPSAILTTATCTQSNLGSPGCDPPFQPTAVADSPYDAKNGNTPQAFKLFEKNLPFFSYYFGSSFGYVANNVNWFAADGIPMTTYDDFGRLNSYPLMRIQARNKLSKQVVASVDTVLPISGEADCRNCHTTDDPANGGLGGTVQHGIAAQQLTPANGVSYPVDAMSDPQYGDLPLAVSVEYAADINILKQHDIDHGPGSGDPYAYTQPLISGTTLEFQLQGQTPPPGTPPFKPVVCQTCHYTPVLDLLQLGPDNSVLTGLSAESNNQSMSRVMHNFHGNLGTNINAPISSSNPPLFPLMPAPTGRSSSTTESVLQASCYQCHPGAQTKCLRGVMANAGIVCQDCHGQMPQVGDDFSRNMPGGSFILAADYYTNRKTPRVPWANEPGCGSCHTGDAVSNLAGSNGTLVHQTDTAGNPDGIRLVQAYLTSGNCTLSDLSRKGCPKPTPIVPTNKRFAENTIASGPAAGNPDLYRLSTETHVGIFCEGCHGSTHAEWPVNPVPLNNGNPNYPFPSGTFVANDNVTAGELQGHTGKIVECDTCHGTADLGVTLNGPHGMHPVGSSRFVYGGHALLARSDLQSCAACHGLQGQGTVLSKVALNRTLTIGPTTVILTQGQLVNCGICHSNPFTSGGGGGHH
jgi:hypothetical protein